MTSWRRVNVEGRTFGETYNKLLLEVYESCTGGEKESYSYGTDRDELFRECESVFILTNALDEPLISWAMPGIKNFPDYVESVLCGTKDNLIGKFYDYTYHERIFDPKIAPGGQLEIVIRRLGKHPYSNRAQVVIWNKPEDNLRESGQPCLQRIWFKALEDTLIVHTYWRSRDLFYAFDENVIGMLAIGLLVKECLNDYFNLNLKNLRYVDTCDSLHVYTRSEKEYKQAVNALKCRGERESTVSSSDKRILNLFSKKNLFEPVYKVKESIFDPIFKK